jgi:hypothetical protein
MIYRLSDKVILSKTLHISKQKTEVKMPEKPLSNKGSVG